MFKVTDKNIHRKTRKVQCHGRTYNEQKPALQIKEISTLPKIQKNIGRILIVSCMYKHATRINLKACAIFQNFPGVYPRPPSFSMLCMLVVLRTTQIKTSYISLWLIMFN